MNDNTVRYVYLFLGVVLVVCLASVAGIKPIQETYSSPRRGSAVVASRPTTTVVSRPSTVVVGGGVNVVPTVPLYGGGTTIINTNPHATVGTTGTIGTTSGGVVVTRTYSPVAVFFMWLFIILIIIIILALIFMPVYYVDYGESNTVIVV